MGTSERSVSTREENTIQIPVIGRKEGDISRTVRRLQGYPVSRASEKCQLPHDLLAGRKRRVKDYHSFGVSATFRKPTRIFYKNISPNIE